MRKLLLILGLILVSFSFALAQNTDKVSQESLLKIGLFGPNIEYEAKISQNFTIVSEAGVSLALGYGGEAIGTIFEYGLIAGVSPRYYYNFNKRLEYGKSIKKYSGNYISFKTVAVLNSVLSSTDDPNQYAFGPTWGLQRNLGKGWFFNFQIGPGLVLSKNKAEFGPIIGLDIGFQL